VVTAEGTALEMVTDRLNKMKAEDLPKPKIRQPMIRDKLKKPASRTICRLSITLIF
jgi:hypothetical protein